MFSASGDHLTRAELGVHLARAGVTAKGVRLAMITMHAELEGLICSGAYRGKQLTYALLAERAPRSQAAVARRRARRVDATILHEPRARDPARLRLVVGALHRRCEARAGDEPRSTGGHRRANVLVDRPSRSSRRAARRRRTSASGPVHLLPVYDEYLIAYRDRDAVPHSVALNASGPGGPLPFLHPLVIDGQLAGTWRPVPAAHGVVVKVVARKLKRSERTALTEAAARYGRFLDAPVRLL